MANIQNQVPDIIGFAANSFGSANAFTVSSATHLYANNLLVSDTKTLNQVFVGCSSISGIGGTVVISVQTSTNGLPSGTQLATVTAATGMHAGWNVVTITQALNAGSNYWIMTQNADGTPGANFWTYQYYSANTNAFGSGKFGGGSHARSTTGQGGLVQSTNVGNQLHFGFTDGSNCGQGLLNVGTANYAAPNQPGCTFTAGANFNIRGVAFGISAQSTNFTGSLAFSLWSGTTKLGDTFPIPNSEISGANWVGNYFANTIPLTAGQNYRCIITSTASTGGTIRVYITDPALPLSNYPLDGGAYFTQLSGGTFTDSTGTCLPFCLWLDTNAPVNSSSGTGGGGSTVTIIGVPFGSGSMLGGIAG